MPRRGRSRNVFFRHEGTVTTDVFFRINPTAIRFKQGQKGSATNTLGGYFYEQMYSDDPQYNGLLLPDLTIEAETGIAFRRELKVIDWIWRHHADRKGDGSPADTYFIDTIVNRPFQGIQRDCPRAYLIAITNFVWDDTVEDPYRIRFIFQCNILRDLFWEVEGGGAPPAAAAPTPAAIPIDNIAIGQLGQLF